MLINKKNLIKNNQYFFHHYFNSINKLANKIDLKKLNSLIKIVSSIKKRSKIIFIGKLYNNRVELINNLSKHIEIDTIERGDNDYFEFLSKLAEYKYVLSPKSLFVNGIPGRFYESLWVESIPLQEIYDDTLDYYTIERDNSNAVFFNKIVPN